jgi:muconolactone delta-isomerase
MKRSYMVEFELPEQLTEDFLALIPEQRLMVDNLMNEGKVRSYSLAMDRSVLWMIVDANSEFEAMETIAQLPLSDYMQPFISELMFHTTSEAALHFSLN